MPPKPQKYNWIQKRKETESMAADYGRKKESVENDDFEEAKIFGREELEGFDSKIAHIEESLNWKPYARSLGKYPSSAQIVQLKGAINESFTQYKSKSAEIAERAERAAENARLVQEIARANPQRGPIRPRGAPSPLPLHPGPDSPAIGRGLPPASSSMVSLTESSYIREPTPQPIPMALPPPPRSRNSTSRRFGFQGNVQPEFPIASSSKYPHQDAKDARSYYQRHRQSDSFGSFGYPQRFSIDTQRSEQTFEIYEGHEEVSEENE